MKKNFLPFVACLFVFRIGMAQTIHNNDFKWTITIPLNFTSIDSAEWAKMKNKGAGAVEKTYDTKVEDHSKSIFVFKTDQFNYFESSYQPFDVKVDGDYTKTSRGVDEILYQTFISQMPNAKIDTSFTRETISGLSFDVFKLRIDFPNNPNIQLHMLMFSRLFDKRELTVNVMYIDPRKGNLMLDAWRNSKIEN